MKTRNNTRSNYGEGEKGEANFVLFLRVTLILECLYRIGKADWSRSGMVPHDGIMVGELVLLFALGAWKEVRTMLISD